MSKTTRKLSLILILAISCEGTNIVQYSDEINHMDAQNRTCVGGFATSFALHNDLLVVGYPYSRHCASGDENKPGLTPTLQKVIYRRNITFMKRNTGEHLIQNSIVLQTKPKVLHLL